MKKLMRGLMTMALFKDTLIIRAPFGSRMKIWARLFGQHSPAGGKSTTQSKELNRQEMKTFACEWWNKFGFAKDKATCTWVIDEIDPDHFVDFIFDFLTKYGHDTRLTEES